MCAVAVSQTSLPSSDLTLSFKPMANNIRVTPSSAMNSRLAISGAPMALSTNPAARNPTSGGRRMAIASNPAAKTTTR